MADPIVIDLPHSLGAAEAKRRLQSRIGELKDHIPGGAAEVESHWTGDRMNLKVTALNQEVVANIDVLEKIVRLELVLPPMLGFFGKQIEALIRRKGPELLEDRSGGGSH
ncbi:polyhydroxyalkanoic acid system family protein [Sphingosinicella rhizophila]|uniref:Polyhydroxyalkanoic acid system family protein n=1 Tax=Sphingosinicella rhizophila TaxID=3050082 RepID=A0ABU3Q782_9SPHN|nr:polyhydroxyalkanoic acid system family protein [Sphingosinicella sp. GR2756]MDT9599268.1 polyhydroxyalkanoic acid system family protein [Sphingosinicella sp. GR2756]